MKFEEVVRKCHVVFSEDIHESIQEYCRRGPDRFYFTEVKISTLFDLAGSQNI